jgi:hypothetical protein
MIQTHYDRKTNTTSISVNDMTQISNNLPLTMKLKNIVTIVVLVFI